MDKIAILSAVEVVFQRIQPETFGIKPLGL
jgi:hypothetical protein